MKARRAKDAGTVLRARWAAAAFVLSASLAACGEAAPDPAFARWAGSPAVAGECAGGAELALRPEAVVRVRTGAIPLALAAAGRDTLFFLDPSLGDLVVYDAAADRAVSQVPAGSLRLLAPADAGVLAAQDSVLYRIASPDGSRREAGVVRGARGPVVSVAEEGGRLWAVTGSRTAGELWSLAAGAAEPPARVTLPGPAHVRALGGGVAVAALVNAPHTLFFFDARLRELARLDPPAPGRKRLARGGGQASVSMGVLPLDCARLLQVITDMRSDERHFVLYELGASGPRVLRTRTVEAPIGLVQSIPGERRLLGFRDAGGTREIVLFGWSWQ